MDMSKGTLAVSNIYDLTKTQFSLNELLLLKTITENAGQWKTKKQWSELSGISHWTLNGLLTRFVAYGLLERQEMKPAIYYQLNPAASSQIPDLMARSAKQLEVLASIK